MTTLHLTSEKGARDSRVHEGTWTFRAARLPVEDMEYTILPDVLKKLEGKSVDAEETKMAKELKLHGAGQDLLVDAFSGNIEGNWIQDSSGDGFPGTEVRAIGSIYDYKTEHGATNKRKASILFITSSYTFYIVCFLISVITYF